jgi:hypothetical protein
LNAGNVTLGQGTIQNAVLVPGNNSLPIRAMLDLKNALHDLRGVLAAEAKSLSQGNLLIYATVNTAVYNGAHISYIEEVLNKIVLQGDLPIKTVLAGTVQTSSGGIKTLISNILSKLNATEGNNTAAANLLAKLNGTDGLDRILEGLGGMNSSRSMFRAA